MPSRSARAQPPGSLFEDERAIALVLSYRTALFDRATIETLMGWLMQALATAVDAPSAAINDLALGGDDHAPALAGRRTDVSALKPVHALILAHAVSTPDHVAVVADDGRLTYRMLAARVGGLAAEIAAVAGTDAPMVAVLTGRTTSFVVAMLAALDHNGLPAVNG